MPLDDGDLSSSPLDQAAFAAAMQALGLSPAEGPFAVAVSGGVDSMALVLLAAAYAPVLALTVDHGLRPESREEALRVQAFLKKRGIAHRILTLSPSDWPQGQGSLEARARLARYAALEEAAASAGIRHLLLAHTRADQAETVLLRLLAGSGLEGLAAMAASVPPLVVPDGPMRHRPLLGVSRTRLHPVVCQAGWEPVVDPMNRDPRFARVAVRQWLTGAPGGEQAIRRISAVARKLARAQVALDRAIDCCLGRAVRLREAGFAWLDPEPLLAAEEELRLRALSRLVQHLGGAAFAPREKAVARLLANLARPNFTGATLAGVWFRPGGARVLVCREPAMVSSAVPLRPGRAVRWDGRFVAQAPADLEPGWTIGPLGARWREPVQAAFGRGGATALQAIPGPVRPSLACLRDPRGGLRLIAGVPQAGEDVNEIAVAWAPLRPLFRDRQSLSA